MLVGEGKGEGNLSHFFDSNGILDFCLEKNIIRCADIVFFPVQPDSSTD